MALYSVRFKNGVVTKNMDTEKPSRNLPYWLQIMVAFASIISSLGIVIALQQMRVSSEQFAISNRGLLVFKLRVYPAYYTGEENQYKQYVSGFSFVADAENVGHTPIQFKMTNWAVSMRDTIYTAIDSTSMEEVDAKLYPTEKMDVNMRTTSLTDSGAYFEPRHFNTLNFQGHFTVEYWDVTNPSKVSKIDRVFILKYDEDDKRYAPVYVKTSDVYK